MTSSLPAGLRERKKAKTRAALREHAMRLFEEQGFAATTVEQIAEAAEVSPSTFFRYFATKEDAILVDDVDLSAFLARFAGVSNRVSESVSGTVTTFLHQESSPSARNLRRFDVRGFP